MSNTILFVDDSETIRKFISFGLRIKGYKVVTASDGQEAMEKLVHNKVEIVVTDLNMPNMDGFELIENLKNDDEFSKLPIIVLTTENMREEKDRAMRLGADSYLVKPFKIDLILRTLKELIQKK